MSQYTIIHHHNIIEILGEKKKKRHLLEVACTVLIHMEMPKYFWEDVIFTACYLINRMPS